MVNTDSVQAFDELLKIIHRLRAPDGCPWDREQTPLSMRGTLVEECFETLDALTEEDSAHVREELGDLLLNTLMIAYMYEQDGAFSLAGMMDNLREKLIRRHPHVFAVESKKPDGVNTAGQVLEQWDAIKKNVEGRKQKCVLDEVSKGLPPLLRAYKLQKKAAKYGFDWEKFDPVLDKVSEELAELRQACLDVRQGAEQEQAELKSCVEDEAGDLLFAAINAVRHAGIDPETALNRANAKFYRRFGFVEKSMNEAGLPLVQGQLKQMDVFWNKAKQVEKEV